MDQRREFNPGGTCDYIFEVIRSYPLPKAETYKDALRKLKKIKEEADDKVMELSERGILEKRVLEGKKLEDLAVAYYKFREIPYDVAEFLARREINKEPLINFFLYLSSFIELAEEILKERIQLRQEIDKNPAEAKRLGIKFL